MICFLLSLIFLSLDWSLIVPVDVDGMIAIKMTIQFEIDKISSKFLGCPSHFSHIFHKMLCKRYLIALGVYDDLCSQIKNISVLS